MNHLPFNLVSQGIVIQRNPVYPESCNHSFSHNLAVRHQEIGIGKMLVVGMNKISIWLFTLLVVTGAAKRNKVQPAHRQLTLVRLIHVVVELLRSVDTAIRTFLYISVQLRPNIDQRIIGSFVRQFS